MSKIKSGVNPALNILKSKNAIVTHKIGKSNMNNFYGSTKWLDDSGNVKPEHIYDTKQLTKSQEYDI
jgi:hypothetical protein